ncbi:mechanosensitive ion channel domain-containing protein [Robertkochia aurantiaca]|uniref:mechanosensitive ion channel domain-containing protein n=1 Tax=Robertkochia aurantiaca TaxID=2873700 RepID=UPI001CCB3958|nr:mechanosensitive ion channel domain-containing protein [Robertkochia sp. 3YJGBD-33]
MIAFLTEYQDSILRTVFTLVLLLLIRYITAKAIRRVGRIGEFDRARTILIIKYVNVMIFFLGVFSLGYIWGLNFQDLGLILSSVLAVLGVAFFASWSILSNVTAGVILFFSFPFKIGDKIRIQDKDFPTESVIEDIKAFHIHLRTPEGELVTYPNNLFLQKGVVVLTKSVEPATTSPDESE